MLAPSPCICLEGTYLQFGVILYGCIDVSCYGNKFSVSRKYFHTVSSAISHKQQRSRSRIRERGRQERHLVGDSSHGEALDLNLAHMLGIEDLLPPKKLAIFFNNYLVENKYGMSEEGRILENFINTCNIMI